MKADEKVRLLQVSARLRSVFSDMPDKDEIIDTFDYIIGAIYSLLAMDGLPFWERPGSRLPDYQKKLVEHWKSVDSGASPGPYWLSGYFFNCALVRIAASFDRVPKLIQGIPRRDPRKAHELIGLLVDSSKTAKWKLVYDEVNPLKHWAIGLSEGRNVSIDTAVAALEEAADLLETHKTGLQKRYA